ncbi:uncharacterized protein LOC114268223 [Camellia sinensis]|uniref:uncharacterized protein LOC114268223 n=1 Tax=Camellia sinensis TaxID=4442 RepID=UPI00103650ED|nr:uncharacterized protein LOC114268223 [Camellia sinensis]
MTSNEELVKQKDVADVKIDGLQRELEGEHAKAMEERDNLQKELEEERTKASSERASVQRELAEERAKVASERATLQKELEEERAKAASERRPCRRIWMKRGPRQPLKGRHTPICAMQHWISSRGLLNFRWQLMSRSPAA